MMINNWFRDDDYLDVVKAVTVQLEAEQEK